MKSRSLFKKNMILIILPIIIVSVLLVLVLRLVISDYFRKDSYQRLDRELKRFETNVILENDSNSQLILDESADSSGNKSPESGVTDTRTPPVRPQNIANGEVLPGLAGAPASGVGPGWSPNLNVSKSVETSFVVRVGVSHFRVLGENDSVEAFELEQIIDNEIWPLEGETSLGSEVIFYSITPVTNKDTLNNLNIIASDKLYHIAYISESYSKDLSQVVMEVFMLGLSLLIIVVSLIVFYVFRHMTNRIKILEKGVIDIGKGNFHAHLSIEPYDEIGRLSDAMNKMSRQLAIIQEEQAEDFQMISHELKTPIMVMEGYLDALLNKQYPNGTKEASYKVLNNELKKLERLTKDIILLNKQDYLSKNKVEMEKLSLGLLFDDTVKRLNTNEELDILIKGNTFIIGDRESWLHVVENIMTNNLRYAKSRIVIELGEDISIKNDGPKIEEHLLARIKKPFVKGKSGRSGLGLAIVTNILKLYKYELTIKNHENGVEYFIGKVS